MPDFSNKALGKKEALPDRPALMLAPLLTGVVPEVPTSADHITGVPDWELGDNDRFGTCGPTSVANGRRMTTYMLTGNMDAVALEDVFDLYRRSGNANFNPADPWDDNGVYMHIMMEQLLRDGIGGRKPLAFAKIAPGDMDTLDKAIALFGGVHLGLYLQTAQQRQSTWDYVPGSGQWGGHAVFVAAYRDPEGTALDRTTCITWKQPLEMTRAFIENLEDEAWVVIWPEHLESTSFLQGVDISALASAFEELTGRPFPVTEPEAPVPADNTVAEALAVALRRTLKRPSTSGYLRRAAEDWLDSRDD